MISILARALFRRVRGSFKRESREKKILNINYLVGSPRKESKALAGALR
jgi:hypothetical protein